jgi:hypothetical protein
MSGRLGRISAVYTNGWQSLSSSLVAWTTFSTSASADLIYWATKNTNRSTRQRREYKWAQNRG